MQEEGGMPEAKQRDAEATRLRILAAATAEFAAHGFAGARIDRIAEAASANKRMIYAYYGNKGALFDRVIEHVFEHLEASVPFTPDDLVGYATTLFDYLMDHPNHLRIDAWRRLERPAATDVEREMYQRRVDSLAELQADFGMGGRFGPGDVLTIVVALASAWEGAPDGLRPFAAKDRDRQRELVAGTMYVLASAIAPKLIQPKRS